MELVGFVYRRIPAVSTECAIRLNRLADTEAELLGLKVSAALASAKVHLSKDTDDITTKKKDHYFLAIA